MSINVPNNGLSSADEAPLSYFFRYAENYFNAMSDLEEVSQRSDESVSPNELELMRHHAKAWLEMTRVQAEKYGAIIVQNRVGSEMLDRLGFSGIKEKLTAKKQMNPNEDGRSKSRTTLTVK